MEIVLLVPPIQGIPTGGNRFNDEIAGCLGSHLREMAVWSGPASAPRVPATAWLCVDSLLARDPAVHAAILAYAGACPKALVAHYLPFCDPFGEMGARPDPATVGAYDAVVATSRHTAGCLRRIGIADGCVGVIYPGTPAMPRAHGGTGGACRVLSVASMLPAKGMLDALDALAALSNRDWYWDVAGSDALDTAYAARVRDQVAARGLEGRVTFHGALPPARMPALYAGADLFLSASRYESLGMAIREAMAAGLPVVAYDAGGVAESVVDGETGLLAATGDTAALSRALDRLIAAPSLRAEMGRAGRRAAARFPGWGAAADALVAFLGQCRPGR